MTLTRDDIWLAAAFLLINAGLLFEFAGLHLKGAHTITWLSHDNPLLRVTILLAILAAAGIWWVHSSHVPAR